MNDPETPQDPTRVTTEFVLRVAAQHEHLVGEQLATIRAEMRGVEREATARRDGMELMFGQRLAAMDKATDLLASDLRKVPSDLQIAMTSIKELANVKFVGIEDRFTQNDKQTAREKAAADLAVKDAFAAADKASNAQNYANSESIRKSEASTAEVIKKNEQTQQQGQQALADRIEDDRARMTRMEQQIITLQTERTTQHDSRTDVKSSTTLGIGALGVFVAVAAVVVTIIATRSPSTTVDTSPPANVQTVTVATSR